MNTNVKILDGFNTVILTDKIYGETHYEMKNNDCSYSETLIYRPWCKYYHIYGKKENISQAKILKSN